MRHLASLGAVRMRTSRLLVRRQLEIIGRRNMEASPRVWRPCRGFRPASLRDDPNSRITVASGRGPQEGDRLSRSRLHGQPRTVARRATYLWREGLRGCLGHQTAMGIEE